MASWITKIRVKRYFNRLKKFLDDTKEYETKKISLMAEGMDGYNPVLNGLSYVHLHCEDSKGSEPKDFYLTMTKEADNQLWGIALTLALRFGFIMK